ncbi:cellulase family glycosylhydrolase [Microbacterium sp. NPDC057659]|uniref:glycoside hydrolase 5 family protein n=1 Tax=Microbacterium sp. NPDC057659 TaxID=3346198 RepID=UPI00366FC5CD
MRRPSPMLTTGESPVIWLGANFWSKSGGPRMWTAYDADLVREELRVLAEHGLNMTRSFVYWPDFQPTPYTLDEDCITRFADFLDAHIEAGMTTVPTFIVGHMSGENWDPAWREGRDLYRDSWFLGRQAWYVRELTARFHAHPAVTGWLLSNEVPIYGGEAPREAVHAWADILIDAVRAGGGTQPVSVGDGAWGIETTGKDNGFALADLAERSDFVGPHVYRMENDQIRQNLKSAFVTELCHIGERPVVLEEFGVTSDYVSPTGAADYYRQQLYNTLLAGATGWIAWNNADYDDLATQRPYSHHPFEMHFGITDRTGAPKPPLLELQRFAADLAAIDVAGVSREDVDAAIIVPSHLAADYPFTYLEERQTIVRTTEQAYLAAHAAHLPVALLREREDGGLDDDARLYLLPSIKQLCATSWTQLGELAEDGATVYASYCVGEAAEQRGPWWAYTEELFGVQRENLYGIVERVADEVVGIRFVEEFGGIAAGTRLEVRAGGTEHSRAYLPVTPTSGTVVAVDDHGRPVLVVQERGAGRLVLGTYPLEYFAAVNAHVNPDDTSRLYRALADVAGIRPAVDPGDPRVFVDTLRHRDGARFAFFVSQHDTRVSIEPRSEHRLATLDGDDGSRVDLPPFGVAIRRLVTD